MFERFSQSRSLSVVKQTSKRLVGAQGETNLRSFATRLIDQYHAMDQTGRLAFFEYLASDFNPDPDAVLAAATRYRAQPDAGALIALIQSVEPARQELLRRVNRAPTGTASIIDMRLAVLSAMRERPEFAAIDADMRHLLGSWFNPGFLELHRITWNSPAQLLEKIIHHESVHAIDGWDDLRRRLQPDRRCYAFFHPQLPQEPLIFVEVALVPTIASSIGGLIDKQGAVGHAKTFKAAIFYSISNCQPGLRGISLGNFLIKRVAEELLREAPTLKSFCTLSPIPSFTRWLDRGAPLAMQGPNSPSPAEIKRIDSARSLLGVGKTLWRDNARRWQPSDCSEAEQAALMRLGAAYLAHATLGPEADPVATFHMSNGATLYRLNWNADSSAKGISQSAGLMVNYLYELDAVEAQHEAFVNGKLRVGREVAKLL